MADSAKVGRGCVFGKNIVIEENVQIGDNVYIGHNVVIHEGTRIGSNVHVDDCCIIGKLPKSGVSSTREIPEKLPPLKIGNGSIMGSNVILYRGSMIGNEVFIGDLASIREQNEIGDRVIIGRLVVMEPMTRIGQRVRIAAGTHLTSNMIIEDDVFMGTEVSSSNDNTMGRRPVVYRGAHIKRGARIGSNSTLLPGVVVGVEAVVAAGTVVNRDVPDRKIIAGASPRIICDAWKLDTILTNQD
ncbi:MAG: N-acetyltransferase [Dehalococcoidia bacterium]|nr:N-acetyltransferase [Dehalococcoidia bacterium]